MSTLSIDCTWYSILWVVITQKTSEHFFRKLIHYHHQTLTVHHANYELLEQTNTRLWLTSSHLLPSNRCSSCTSDEKEPFKNKSVTYVRQLLHSFASQRLQWNTTRSKVHTSPTLQDIQENLPDPSWPVASIWPPTCHLYTLRTCLNNQTNYFFYFPNY